MADGAPVAQLTDERERLLEHFEGAARLAQGGGFAAGDADLTRDGKRLFVTRAAAGAAPPPLYSSGQA